MTRSRRTQRAAILAASVLGGSLVVAAPLAGAQADGAEDRSATAAAASGDRGGLGSAPTRTPRSTGSIDKTVRTGTPASVARAHLAANQETYHLDVSDLRVVDTVPGKGHDSVRLAQRHHGVPVFGAQYVVHTEDRAAGRVVTSTIGRVYTDLAVSTAPAVTEQVARQRLRLDDTVATTRAAVVEPAGLVVLPTGAGQLAWQFDVTGTAINGEPVRQRVFVDALVGGIALSYSMIATGEATRGTGVRDNGDEVPLQITRTDEGAFELRDRSRAMFDGTDGEILTYDAQDRDYSEYAGSMPDDTPIYSSATDRFEGDATTTGAVDAHVNSGKVYEYFLEVLGRDGIDGEGGTMRSVVNVTANGADYRNAFWDGQKMVYGSNEGVPFSVALDVVGHEMAHGITEHSSNLQYINQSGALNEAISDYFGNAMETDDLGIATTHPDASLLGEHLCHDTPLDECAIRDLDDDRRADEDYLLLAAGQDNGGVHLNSTIASGALWDIREGIDPVLADRIVYAANTEYLTPLSTFTDLRSAVELAAARENVSDADAAVISAAFDAHGIYQGWEESGYDSDATPLMTDIVSGYEGWAAADDSAAVVDGDRWAASTLGIQEFFAGTNKYTITTGEFGKSDKTREINNHGAWDLNPAISGGQLAWTRITPQGVDVVGQKGDGLGGTTVLAGGPGDQIRPHVDGDTLVWLTVGPVETDVWVRQGQAAPVNLTPEEGTAAIKVRVRDGVVTWTDGTRVHVETLVDGSEQVQRIPGWVFNSASDLQLSDDGLFVRVSGFFGDSILFAPVDVLAGLRKLDLGGSVYGVQFAVNDDHFAFGTTTIWGSIGYPSNEESHKLRAAEVADVIAGTAEWERVACASGAQISPAFGDATRLVWLDTSMARTDLVTRDSWAGTC